MGGCSSMLSVKTRASRAGGASFRAHLGLFETCELPLVRVQTLATRALR